MSLLRVESNRGLAYFVDDVKDVAGGLLEFHLTDLSRLRGLNRVENGFAVVANLVFNESE